MVVYPKGHSSLPVLTFEHRAARDSCVVFMGYAPGFLILGIGLYWHFCIIDTASSPLPGTVVYASSTANSYYTLIGAARRLKPSASLSITVFVINLALTRVSRY